MIKAIIGLPPDTHIAVKHTSIHMLGELSEWIEKHPEVIGMCTMLAAFDGSY